MNDVSVELNRLARAIEAANAAAEKLTRCAEGISNPVYSVVMDGKELSIQAVRHFQGQISIQVANPFTDVQRKQQHLAHDVEPARLSKKFTDV